MAANTDRRRMGRGLAATPKVRWVFLLAGITVACPAYATSLPSGLIGYYTFDNKIFVGRFGARHKGMARGHVRFGSGVGSGGYAMSLIARPHSSGGVDLQPRPYAQTGSLSVTFWFYPSATQRTEYSAMIYRKSGREQVFTADRSYAVWWITGGVHVVYTPKGANTQDICTNKSFGLPAATWHRFALTLDSKTQLAAVYLDGRLVKTCPYAGGMLTSSYRELVLADLPIGYHGMPEAGPFTGSLDDVRFYRRRLSPPRWRNPTPMWSADRAALKRTRRCRVCQE
jgi:hypothetical protein